MGKLSKLLCTLTLQVRSVLNRHLEMQKWEIAWSTLWKTLKRFLLHTFAKKLEICNKNGLQKFSAVSKFLTWIVDFYAFSGCKLFIFAMLVLKWKIYQLAKWRNFSADGMAIKKKMLKRGKILTTLIARTLPAKSSASACNLVAMIFSFYVLG